MALIKCKVCLHVCTTNPIKRLWPPKKKTAKKLQMYAIQSYTVCDVMDTVRQGATMAMGTQELTYLTMYS